MPMSQAEIDDISNSFADAWDEYFGMRTYYCSKDSAQPSYSNLYDENPSPDPSAFLGPIIATKLENPTELQLTEFGLTKDASAVFTFITKALKDLGILKINNRDIIRTSENGETLYEVVDYAKSTQFGESFIFTSVGVKDYAGE